MMFLDEKGRDSREDYLHYMAGRYYSWVRSCTDVLVEEIDDQFFWWILAFIYPLMEDEGCKSETLLNALSPVLDPGFLERVLAITGTKGSHQKAKTEKEGE